ncbi:hypothetical protein Ancab_012636 [Ancistrocladus abbreviatus]
MGKSDNLCSVLCWSSCNGFVFGKIFPPFLPDCISILPLLRNPNKITLLSPDILESFAWLMVSNSNDEDTFVWICLVGPCKPLVCSHSVTRFPNLQLEEVCHCVKFHVCSRSHTLEWGNLCYPAHMYSNKLEPFQPCPSDKKSLIDNSYFGSMPGDNNPSSLEQYNLILVATSYQVFECLGSWKRESHIELGGNSKVKGVPTKRIEIHDTSPERNLTNACNLLISFSSINLWWCDWTLCVPLHIVSPLLSITSYLVLIKLCQVISHTSGSYIRICKVWWTTLTYLTLDTFLLDLAVCCPPVHLSFLGSHMESPSFCEALKRGIAAQSSIDRVESTEESIIVSLMLPEDLGMGMVLSSTPCAIISTNPVVMTGIALPEGLGLEFYQGLNHNTLAPIDGFQDEHSVTQTLDTGKKEA